MGENNSHIEEELARDLLRYLTKSFEGTAPSVSLSLSGCGVHWHIDATARARTCRIHCFNYVADGLRRVKRMRERFRLGRADPKDIYRKYAGAEFCIYFFESEGASVGEGASVEFSEGRFHTSSDVVRCVRQWVVDGSSAQSLYDSFPSVDGCQRALSDLADYLNSCGTERGSNVRAEIIADELGRMGHALQISEANRGLRVDASAILEHGTYRCSLTLRMTPIGTMKTSLFSEIADVAHSWMAEQASIAKLAAAVPRLTLYPYIEYFERGDYATWHWNREIYWAREDRKSCESKFMACYLPLLELLGADPVTRRFFTFVSMRRLCFSRCSEFPFATTGMPQVQANLSAYPEPTCYWAACGTDKIKGDSHEIFAFLKRHLANVWESGVYGESVQALIQPANYLLTEQGSIIRVFPGTARDVAMACDEEGGRQCTLSFVKDRELSIFLVTFDREDGKPIGYAYCHRMIQAVALMQRWLDFHQEPNAFMEMADRFEVYGE